MKYPEKDEQIDTTSDHCDKAGEYLVFQSEAQLRIKKYAKQERSYKRLPVWLRKRKAVK